MTPTSDSSLAILHQIAERKEHVVFPHITPILFCVFFPVMLYTAAYLVPELNSQTSTGNSRNPKAVSSGATVHFPSAVICTLATYGGLKSPRCIHKYIWVRSVLQRFADDSFLHAEGTKRPRLDSYEIRMHQFKQSSCKISQSKK